MSNIECPICCRIDQTQRVTAIVRGETQDVEGSSKSVGGTQLSGQTDYYAGRGFERERVGDGRLSANAVTFSTTDINVTQQSRLAKQLAPPSRPKKPNHDLNNRAETILSWVAGILAILISAVLLEAVPRTITEFGGGFGSLVSWVCLGGLLFGVLSLGGSWLMTQSQNPPDKREAEDAQYDREMKRWEAMMARWTAMFYCRRCDVVYIPGDSYGHREPKDIHQLAYSGIE